MKYAISGVAFSGNKGAEGMLLALVQNLRKLDEAAEFCVFSYYPATDRAAGRETATLKIANAGPKHVVRMFFPALWALMCRKLHLPQALWRRGVMKTVAAVDVWLDAAGISFCDGREKFTVFNILTILPALAAGVKVVKVAQALGPFEHKINRMLAKMILPRLALVVARGAQSRAFVDALKLTNVETFSDSAFSLTCSAEDAARAKALLPAVNAPLIGISPSQVVLKLCEAAHVDYCAILRDVVTQCAARGWHCVLFAHSARTDTDKRHNNDLPLLKAFAATLPPELPVTVLAGELEAGELRALIGELDVLVASRFHAIISAMATGVPAAVIGWSHKYEEVLAPFELADAVQSYAEFSAARTLAIVDAMLAKRAELSQKILTESRRIAEENQQFFKQVAAMAQQ